MRTYVENTDATDRGRKGGKRRQRRIRAADRSRHAASTEKAKRCPDDPARPETTGQAEDEHKLAWGDPERPGQVMVVGRVVHALRMYRRTYHVPAHI